MGGGFIFKIGILPGKPSNTSVLRILLWFLQVFFSPLLIIQVLLSLSKPWIGIEVPGDNSWAGAVQ